MIGILKSLQSVFTSIVSDIPDGLRVVLDFVWKARWFIVVGYVALLLYTLVMKMLPFLLWSWAIKVTFGSLFSIFSSL